MNAFINPPSDASLIALVRNYLEYNGYLFPTTRGALTAVKQKIKKNPEPLPPVPFTAADILRNGKLGHRIPKPMSPPVQEEGFRAAARNGKDIPDELRAKMLRDRREAENKKPGHEPV